MESLSIDRSQNEIIIKCNLEDMAKAFFKDYAIIWHDPNVNSQENQQYLLQLEKLCKVQTFTVWKEAEDYIKRAKTVCHVITSGTNGELLVEEIFSSENVPKIFTFCRAKDYHSTWTKNYKKILCTETKIEDVILKIQENLLEWQKQSSSLKFDLPAFAPIFDDHDKSQMNHLHLYLKLIPNFHNRAQAKKDFLDLSKKIYEGQKRSEKFIAKFEDTYNDYDMEAILKWYTRPTFLYKVINNCLRIATSDSIQYCRLLLKDIETAIKDQYQAKSKNFSGVLYRAAYLSEEEWSSLKENVNREIEMHGFLSVSKEDKTAWKFMSENPTKMVFITILVLKGSNEEEQGFAEIEEFSEVSKEQEILFNVRSRFTVLETEDEYSKDSPYRHLVLLYGARGLRKFITEENPEQQVSIEGIESILCSHCQLPTDKMPEKLVFMSLLNLEKQIYYCKNCRGYSASPFLCIPIQEKVHTINIKGCVLANSGHEKIPMYGYKCSQCGVKKEKIYFLCPDCGEKGKKLCENCFGYALNCTEIGHSFILESSPFSFWCERMSEKELNHLKLQKRLGTNSIDEFQQGDMYYFTHEYEKAIDYYNVEIKQNEARGKDDKLANLYNQLGGIYVEQGEYNNALENYSKSLEIAKSAYGENHSLVATSYANIGRVYFQRGEYNQSFECHLKSLDICKSVHGEDHPDIVTSYNNIGSAYERLGEYKKALEYHLKSLDIYKSVHGENHPDIATSYLRIGSAYESLGEYEKALEYLLKSLGIYQSVYGEDHPLVSPSYDKIGLVYHNQGKYKKALECHLKSLEICQSVYGEDNPLVSPSYHNIGLVYSKQGEYKKALEYFLKCLDIDKLVYGENHPDIGISYNNLGSVYEKQGEYEKALESYLKSLDIYKSVHGENHPDIATSCDNIGLIYSRQGEYKKALECHLKSLDIYKSVHGENHYLVAASYNSIASIYESIGENNKALEHYLKCLDISKFVHGGNHHLVAAAENNIGSVYESLGEYEKALECNLKSLNIYKSIHGENHYLVAASYNNIGSIYESLGENNKALEHYLKGLDIFKSLNDKSHPSIAISYDNIGSIYESLGENNKALEYYLKSLDIRIFVHGESHPDIAISYHNIGEVFDHQGEYKKALQYYLKAQEIYKLTDLENHSEITILHDRIREITSIDQNTT